MGLSYNDVLLVPKFSTIESRDEVSLKTEIAPGIELDIPLISANMDTVTGVRMAIAMSQAGGLGFIGRFDKPEVQADKIKHVTEAGQRTIGVIGVKDDYLKRAEMLLEAGSVALHLDVAHAFALHVRDVIVECKKRFPRILLIAGTVATGGGARFLYEAGADAVKVGIGGGSICLTRINAGAGVPSITAIDEAARVRDYYFPDRKVIADGGAASSGDIVKALAAGADAYIGGSIFAGTDETPSTPVEVDGKWFRQYNGSTSKAEKQRQLWLDADHKGDTYNLYVEGVEALVPSKGPVKDVIASLCAGIRSGMSYCGARTIKDLHQNAEFIQISAAGYRESQAHDVIVQT